MPSLSVVLTSHDRLPLLRMAVDSVLTQTHNDLELIVCNDAKEGNGIPEYLERVSRLDRRVVVKNVHHDDGFRKAHKMVGVMVNIGLDMAMGDCISYLCDDDMYFSERCERMMDILEADKDTDMVVGKVRWLLHDGSRMKQDDIRFNYKRPFEEGHGDLLNAIRPSNFICHDSVIHRAAKLRWPVKDTHTPVDWRFWLGLHRAGYRIRTIEEVGELAYYPGTWRKGIDIKKALAARNMGGMMARGAVNKGTRMERVKYAKNETHQIQQIPRPDGSVIRVAPGEFVDAKYVTDSKGNLYPGFRFGKFLDVPVITNSGKRRAVVADTEEKRAKVKRRLERREKDGLPPEEPGPTAVEVTDPNEVRMRGDDLIPAPEIDGDLLTVRKPPRNKYPFERVKLGK